MSGIVNSTGAVSGIIGTTVGTPSGGGKLLNIEYMSDSTYRYNDSYDWAATGLVDTITVKSATSWILISPTVQIGHNQTYGAGGQLKIGGAAHDSSPDFQFASVCAANNVYGSIASQTEEVVAFNYRLAHGTAVGTVLTYQIFYRRTSVAARININTYYDSAGDSSSSLTLREIEV